MCALAQVYAQFAYGMMRSGDAGFEYDVMYERCLKQVWRISNKTVEGCSSLVSEKAKREINGRAIALALLPFK